MHDVKLIKSFGETPKHHGPIFLCPISSRCFKIGMSPLLSRQIRKAGSVAHTLRSDGTYMADSIRTVFACAPWLSSEQHGRGKALCWRKVDLIR